MKTFLQTALKAIEAVEKNLDRKIVLPATGSWPETFHVFDGNTLWAIKAALAAERPLLVRGEPGTGKSQLARAAAHILGRAFLPDVVHSRSECTDLQYSYDAVSRLGEAQALGVTGKSAEVAERLDPLNFLCPGVLWWAFDWESAILQHARCRHTIKKPAVPAGWKPEDGCVVLIDEIDKADVELPNGLLETLGNGSFTVPFAIEKESVGMSEKTPPPLVVITTNEERELPAAFVRRCLVLYLELPGEEEKCTDWLVARGKIHFDGACSEMVMKEVAAQLWKDRSDAIKNGMPAPGQAEYLDMLRAVSRLDKEEKGQLKALEAIKGFALKKNPKESY
jgi:MoxR-like ATPase